MNIKVQLNKLVNFNYQLPCWLLLFVFIVGLNIFNINLVNNFNPKKASFHSTASNKFSDYQIQSSQDLAEIICSSSSRGSNFFQASLSNFSNVEFVVFNLGFNKKLLLNSVAHMITSDSEIKICFRV
jgi:hypothetical protein